jgi:hypothetical protein
MVKWINCLPKKHLLPVDRTLHGAVDTPEVRTVVHLHGARVSPESDGHPEAWFTKGFKRRDHFLPLKYTSIPITSRLQHYGIMTMRWE